MSNAERGISSRRGSGLRNRHRNGRGTYSRQNKIARADRYGKYENGRCLYPDHIKEWIQP